MAVEYWLGAVWNFQDAKQGRSQEQTEGKSKVLLHEFEVPGALRVTIMTELKTSPLPHYCNTRLHN